MADSRLRRPLVTAGVTVLVALVALLSAFTFLARGTFTSNRLTSTLSSGWVAVGVRAPESAGGVVTLMPVGGGDVTAHPLIDPAATVAVADNDPHALSQAAADATRRPMAGAVVLDRLALAALVDMVGGVHITVDRPFRWTSTGTAGALVQPGDQRLNGLAAAAYVLSDGTGGALRRVTAAVITGLPTNHDELSGVVKSLGMSMRATVSAATVVQWLEFWQSRL